MLTETITWEELDALVAHAEGGGVMSPETRNALGDEIVRCEVLQNGGLYRQLRCLRLVDTGYEWEAWKSLEEWLGVKLGLPYKTANERVRVARALARLPRIDAAFRDGLLTYTKVRALHNVATPENEETLLAQARYVTGAQLAKLLAPLRAAVKRAKSSQAAREEARGVHFFDHPTEDLVEVRAILLPEEAAMLRKSLEVGVELEVKQARSSAALTGDSAAAEQPRKRVGFVDALVLVAESFLADPPRAGVPAGRRELLIHTVPDLSQGLLETGGSLSAEAVRRLACDGPTVVVERGSEGEVLDVGRRTRRISRRLERALLVRDRCCRFPGCTRTVLLDAHHVEHWADGGKTRLSNLVRLCRTHHRLVHDGTWTVQHGGDGTITFLDPQGHALERPGRLPEVNASRAHETLRAESLARGLDPKPEQLAALGGGERIPDYGYATTELAYDCGFTPDPDHEDRPAPAVQWLLENSC